MKASQAAAATAEADASPKNGADEERVRMATTASATAASATAVSATAASATADKSPAIRGRVEQPEDA